MAGNGKAAFFGGLSKPQREPSVFPPPYGRGEHEKLSETDTPFFGPLNTIRQLYVDKQASRADAPKKSSPNQDASTA